MNTTFERAGQPKMTPAQYELLRYASEKLGWPYRNLMLFMRLYSAYPFNDFYESPEAFPTQKEAGEVLSYFIHRIKYNRDAARAMAVRLEKSSPELVDSFIHFWQGKTGVSTIHWGEANNHLIPEEVFPDLVLENGEALKVLYKRFVDSFHAKGSDDWSVEEDYTLIDQVAHVRKLKQDYFQSISRMAEMKVKRRTAGQLRTRWNSVIRPAYVAFLEKLQPFMYSVDPTLHDREEDDDWSPATSETGPIATIGETAEQANKATEQQAPTTGITGVIEIAQSLLEQLQEIRFYEPIYVQELESKLSAALQENQGLVEENGRLLEENAGLQKINSDITQKLSLIGGILNPSS